jgi:hypothetical protein
MPRTLIPKKVVHILKTVVMPAIIFLFLTFMFNREIFQNFSGTIEKNDGRLLAWTLAWDNHKLLTDPINLFNPETGIFQANIYYPNQNTLTYSEHAFGISLLSLPAYILSGGNPVVGFNFVMLLCYVLNAFCGYLLVKYLTKSTQAGIIGGSIFAFCSFRILNFGHLQNMPIFYMPLMLLFLYKFIETKKLKYIIGVAVCLLLQSLSSWYHMIFIFLLFACFAGYFLYRRFFTKKDLISLAISVFVVLLLIIPFAIPYFSFNNKNKSAYDINELKTYSADLGGYLLPSPNTFLHDKVLTPLRITKTNWQENFNFLGYIPLLLSLVSFLRIKNRKLSIDLQLSKSKFIFIGTGLLFALLSFGPFLRFNDITTRIPLLYFLVYYLLPPIRFIRAVSRFSTVVFLMLAILSSFGFVKILNRLKNRFVGYVLTVFLIALIVFEYYPYKQFFEFSDVASIPEIYTEIRDNPEVKSIVELPIDVGPFETTGYIYWAGYHLKPLVNGYSGYEPPTYQFIKDILSNMDTDIGLLKLRELGVTHILTNPTFSGDLETERLAVIDELEGYTLYKINEPDENLRVYVNDFDNEFQKGFENVNFKFKGTSLKDQSVGTPYSNISPDSLNEFVEFTIDTTQTIQTLSLKFRAYSINDKVEINCGQNQYSYQNVDYIEDYLALKCDAEDVTIRLLSTEYLDRSMIDSVILFNDTL